MEPSRDADDGTRHGSPRSAEDARTLGVQKQAHGDVEKWLEHNLEDEERGPVEHLEAAHAAQAVGVPRSSDPRQDTLVQLPIGARFGLDHDPSPQEREELVRFAAAANAELQGGGEGQPKDEDTHGHSPSKGT